MAYVGNPQAAAFSSRPPKQDLTGAVGTSLTLSHAVANAESISLFINNVRQEPTTAYSVVGTAVTLTGSVVATDDIYVVYNSLALQESVPPDGSVGTAKISNNAVTTSKLAATIAPTNLETTASTFKMTDLSSNAFYRTGTFTPNFSSTTATDPDASIIDNYAHNKGFYTRIGNLVFANVDIKLASSFGFINGGATGQNLTVVNLPFKFKNTVNHYASINCGFFGFFTGWTDSYTPMGYGELNEKQIILTYAVANGTTNIATNFITTADAHIIFDITYETDDA